jgi:hypothetical protein
VPTTSLLGQIKISDTDISDESWSCAKLKTLELEAKLAYYLVRAARALIPRA